MLAAINCKENCEKKLKFSTNKLEKDQGFFCWLHFAMNFYFLI